MTIKSEAEAASVELDAGEKVIAETLEKLVQADEAAAVPVEVVAQQARATDLLTEARKAKKAHLQCVEHTAKCRAECDGALVAEAKAKQALDALLSRLTKMAEDAA